MNSALPALCQPTTETIGVVILTLHPPEVLLSIQGMANANLQPGLRHRLSEQAQQASDQPQHESARHQPDKGYAPPEQCQVTQHHHQRQSLG